MVNAKLKVKIVLTVIVLMALALSACSNYQFGDVSSIYCGSTNREIRAEIKLTLQDNGIDIGVDYCASVGLVDALVLAPMRNKKP